MPKLMSKIIAVETVPRQMIQTPSLNFLRNKKKKKHTNKENFINKLTNNYRELK